jgi:transposase InsO family protein
MKYVAIRDFHGSLSVSRAASLLGVGRSGYYKWLEKSGQPDDRAVFDLSLREEIQRVAVEYPGYGYRRIAAELCRRGFPVSGKKALRLMRLDNLLCVKKRFRLCTTDSNHGMRVYANLARDIEVMGINQLWVSDITYIQLQQEYVYLAVVLDVYSRRCIGWELSRHIDTRLTMSALQEALKTRRQDELKGLVHHSDQGVQYACHEYVECLQEHGIQVSMSRRGNPYDNAFAESFMKTLKYEEVYLNEYETYEDAMNNIERFIEQVYNQKRLHSSIGYKSPVEFEKTKNLNNVS